MKKERPQISPDAIPDYRLEDHFSGDEMPKITGHLLYGDDLPPHLKLKLDRFREMFRGKSKAR